MSRRHHHSQPIQKQRGAALMVMLVILVIGAATLFVISLNSSALQIARDKTTAAALAQAKDALIGRAVADPYHPGSLPCPDTNNDGVAESLSGSNCPSYIGRLPWKTLGLPDLSDGSGERLWYTLSPNFRDDNSNSINSNSKGTLLIYDNSGTTLLTPPGSEAIAIIFSPGNVVASQQRDTANQNLAQNYLDIGPNSINNATAGGPFIAANKTNSFDDRLMIIRASDIMPNVEMRVAQELKTAFDSYFAANGQTYPHPANFNCTTAANCTRDLTQCIGKVPVADLATFMLPSLSAYFAPNEWFKVIYYTAGTNSLTIGGSGWGGGKWGKGKKKGGGSGSGSGGGGSTLCTTIPPFLTVQDTNGNPLTTTANALLLMPDTPLGGIIRTPMSTANLPDYFEDADNLNLNNVYVMPTAISNDSLYILP